MVIYLGAPYRGEPIISGMASCVKSVYVSQGRPHFPQVLGDYHLDACRLLADVMKGVLSWNHFVCPQDTRSKHDAQSTSTHSVYVFV